MRTLKLEIDVIGENKQTDIARLKQILQDVWKSANIMITSQFMSSEFLDKSYKLINVDLNKKYSRITKIEELLKIKNNSELKTELAQLKKIKKNELSNRMKSINAEFQEKFGVLKDSLSERDVKLQFDNLPSCVTNSLKNNIKSNWNNELFDIQCGNKTIRTYKKGMPAPISQISMTFNKDSSNIYYFTWKATRNEIIKFKIILRNDNGNYSSTLDKIINMEIKQSISSIQFKKNKFFLNLCVNDVKKKIGLNPNICVGVDLGINTPAYVATNKKATVALGDKNDFFKVRMAIQRKKRKAQKNAIMSKGGHGRKRKMKAVNRNSDLEKNFVKTYNHKISKEIIKFALQENAGVIKLELLKGFGENKKKSLILRNWSYFELQQYIKYKAEQIGITVKFVDPYHTSQICSKCGHFEPNQRNKKSNIFTCGKCNTKLNGDMNAARNIARSEKYVTSTYECEFNKQKKTKIDIYKIFKNTSDIDIKLNDDGTIDVSKLIAINSIKQKLKIYDNHLNSVIEKAPSLYFNHDKTKICKKLYK